VRGYAEDMDVACADLDDQEHVKRRRVSAQSTWKKSHASIVEAWVRRNSHQGLRLRCGAGRIRSRLSTRRTMETATLMPRPSSSPRIRL
jgi:hypothetical protein